MRVDPLPRAFDRLLLGGSWRAALTTALLGRLAPARLRAGAAVVVADRRDQSIFARLALGLFERGERAFVDSHVDGDCLFVDVGANCGWYSALAAARGARVFALEPDPRSFARLARTAAARPELITPLQLAAADVAGIGRLHRSATNRGDHRLTAFAQAHDSVEVQQVTLDSCLPPAATAGRWLFVKLDVQGWEAHALAGARETLARHRRATLMFEFHPDGLRAAGTNPADMLAAVEADGFTLWGVDDGGQLHRLDPDHAGLIEGLRGELFTNLVALRD